MTTDTEPLDLDAIEARVQDATEGPWALRYMLGRETWPLIVADGIGTIANIADHGMSEEDARFIAHAREDVPALIAEVRRLREEAGREWERGILYGDNYEYFAGPGELRRLTEIGVQLREVRRRPAGPWEGIA